MFPDKLLKLCLVLSIFKGLKPERVEIYEVDYIIKLLLALKDSKMNPFGSTHYLFVLDKKGCIVMLWNGINSSH